MGIGLDLWGLRRDGSEVPVQVSLSPVNTAAGLHTMVVVREVSEHRANEQAERAGLLLGESERIAAELHQTVIERLFRAGITIQSAIRLTDGAVAKRLYEAVDEIDTAIREIREAVFNPDS
jgi:signal transduction histidine kinase